MKKWWFAAVAIILVGAIAVPVAWAQTEDTQAWPKAYSSPAGTKLTDSQKKALADLYSKIADLKKQIVDKYVEFKVIDKDRAELIKQKIDQIEKKRAEQGYLPGFGRKKPKGDWKPKKNTTSCEKCPSIQENSSQPAKNSQ